MRHGKDVCALREGRVYMPEGRVCMLREGVLCAPCRALLAIVMKKIINIKYDLLCPPRQMMNALVNGACPRACRFAACFQDQPDIFSIRA